MENNNLFDRFRENANQLEEMPSNHAWRKLESRLDTHESRGQTSLYRTLAMAAAVVALVAVTFVITMMTQTEPNGQMAEARPTELEDLEIFTDVSEEAYKIVQFTRQHTSRLSNPISDGHPGKKLLASYKDGESNIRPAVVLGSKEAAEQKAMTLKNKHFEAFRDLLYSDDVQTFFGKGNTMYVYKTPSLCNTIDCENFQLEKTKQTVFFAAKEDLFMRANPNHMVIEASLEGEKVNFKYALKGSTN